MSDLTDNLPDPELAFKIIEANFIYKDNIRNQDSAVAKKLKRYCAFLYFYFSQAEEKSRMFDALRPRLDIVTVMKDDDARMTVWWWAYLDAIVHTSNLYDKPTGGNEPASLPFLNSKLPMWGKELGVPKVPELADIKNDESLKNLLGLRDKLIIHIEPKSYFKVMFDLRDVPNFFDHLINEVAKPYLEEVYDTFFIGKHDFTPKTENIDAILKLKLKIE
jgi:hypothetical protein